MLVEKINEMIATAMKAHDAVALQVYKLIKTELVKAQKDGVELNDVNEAKILLKMAAQREDSINQFISGGRNELAEAEKKELEVLQTLIPKQPTDEEIAEYTSATISAYVLTKEDGYKVSMKDMKPILTLVQEKYPSANGKIVSKTLQSVIK